MTLLWQIFRHCNPAMPYGFTSLYSSMLVFKSYSSDKHLKDLQSFGLFPTIKARTYKLVRWIPPDHGLVLNVDGASKGNPDDLLVSTSVDVDHKSAATSMDAYSELAAIDVDVNLPDMSQFQIQKRPRNLRRLFRKPSHNGVVFLLMKVSRGEMSLGVRIRVSSRPQHPRVALQAQLEAQERADVWWSSLLRTRFEDGTVEVGWNEFVRLFRAKFVPEHIQDKMEQEFLSLTQGSMTILEYEAWLSELSKYAPHIVADERRKAKKFMMGLRPSLRTRLVAFDHRTLEQALSAACRQEGEMEQYLEEKKAS
ncbi:hypothetical protein Taro_051790 [Colocasia esculenta]|uniref:Retrotransposon gag domain-containing protein n=1 Tax=Colocasia esculenta TaxID=4460 RepID=A0A843XI36_COLES|nr:hypothetical protein [Colocasia esculenta]